MPLIFLRKIWAYVKAYWYVPLILIGLLVSLKAFKSLDLDKILEKGRKTHEKEVEKINEIEKNKEAKRKEIEKKAQDRVIQIETELLKEQQILKEEHREEVAKIAQKYSDKPEKIAEHLNKKYGYKVILPKE